MGHEPCVPKLQGKQQGILHECPAVHLGRTWTWLRWCRLSVWRPFIRRSLALRGRSP